MWDKSLVIINKLWLVGTFMKLCPNQCKKNMIQSSTRGERVVHGTISTKSGTFLQWQNKIFVFNPPSTWE